MEPVAAGFLLGSRAHFCDRALEDAMRLVEVRNANAPVTYDPVAKTLHWLTVLLVVTQFMVAWTMPAIHHGTKPRRAEAPMMCRMRLATDRSCHSALGAASAGAKRTMNPLG